MYLQSVLSNGFLSTAIRLQEQSTDTDTFLIKTLKKNILKKTSSSYLQTEIYVKQTGAIFKKIVPFWRISFSN